MSRVKGHPTENLKCLFASLMFTKLLNHFPLLTMDCVINFPYTVHVHENLKNFLLTSKNSFLLPSPLKSFTFIWFLYWFNSLFVFSVGVFLQHSGVCIQQAWSTGALRDILGYQEWRGLCSYNIFEIFSIIIVTCLTESFKIVLKHTFSIVFSIIYR